MFFNNKISPADSLSYHTLTLIKYTRRIFNYILVNNDQLNKIIRLFKRISKYFILILVIFIF